MRWEKAMEKVQKRQKYTTVFIPISLMERVKEVVENGKYGYQNNADFVLDSIRKRLRELGALE